MSRATLRISAARPFLVKSRKSQFLEIPGRRFNGEGQAPPPMAVSCRLALRWSLETRKPECRCGPRIDSPTHGFAAQFPDFCENLALVDSNAGRPAAIRVLVPTPFLLEHVADPLTVAL